MEKLMIKQNDPSVIELGKADPQMNKLIHAVGDIEVAMRPDLFKSLVRSIIGQQFR